MRKTTWLTSLGLAACLLGAASCSSDSEPGTAGPDTSATSGADEAAQTSGAGPDDAAATSGAGEQADAPDLSDVPDPVAEVNGTQISKDEFTEAYQPSYEQAAMQAEAMGQPVDEAGLREQTVEGLISTELLMQASDEHGLEATQEDIDAELEELATGNGMASTEEFLAALEEQGMSADEVNEEVERMVKVDQLIEQEADVTEPTEEEIRAYYDELVAQQGGGESESGSTGAEVPGYEEVKDQVAEQLASERENEAIQGLIEQLRSEGEVTVHLEGTTTE